MFGVNANIPPTPSPLFQPASNRLVLQSMQINETRSSHQDSDSDSDKVGFAVALEVKRQRS